MKKQRICDFIARWMGVIVLLVAALSLFVPASLAWIGTWVINPMLGVIMFGMGLTLSANDLKIVLSRPKDILIGCLTQFTVMPLLAWALTKVFSLPQELAIGVILVGCCPGGTASNVITYLAKGDLALSVGMTAASTLLAPLLTPLLVWLLAGTMVDVHTTGMLMSIVYIVILPIVCGLLCQRFIPQLTQRVTSYLPAFSSLAVALTVGIVVSHNADRLLTAGLLVVLVVMLHNLFGLGIGYLVGRLLRLQRPKSIALSIEVGMQNSGLATSLAVMHFAAFPLATIPGAVFSVWHNISGAIIARIYSRTNMNLCKNIKQGISSYWRSFRAWQEHPVSYRMDENEHVCNNCGHTFRGNYCPVCSQSARHGRISWTAIWQGIAQLWGIESRSAVYTLWQLFLRPGYLVRDYISGKRQVSYPPVKLLFILAAVVTLARYFFPVPTAEPSHLGFKYLDWASDWLSNHENISELLTGCVFVLPTWFLFRKAPNYPNHTIPEGFYLQVYLAILSFIFYSIFFGHNGIALTLTLCYYFMAYKQLFGFSFWGTLWRLTICVVLGFTAMLLIAMCFLIPMFLQSGKTI